MVQTPKPAVDPGQQYGIIGLIMLVIGLPFIGIFLSIIGYKKSKKAGYTNTLAKVGIWLNALFCIVLLALIVGVVYVIRSFDPAGQGALRAANTVIDSTTDYAASNDGQYPSFAQIQKIYNSNTGDVVGDYDIISDISNVTSNTVAYRECRDSAQNITGAVVAWDESYMAWTSSARKVFGSCPGFESTY